MGEGARLPGGQFRVLGLELIQVLRMDVLEYFARNALLGGVAQGVGDAAADVMPPTIDARDADDVARMFGERHQAMIAPLSGARLDVALGHLHR
jgi:hypothetical protein